MTYPRSRILFGTELRRRRTEAGLSLTGLAQLVHYSKSHLSKVETGSKPPSPDLARRCDAALGGGGALARLADSRPVAASALTAHDPGEVWVLSLGAADGDQFGVLSRREVIAGGIAGLALWTGLTAGGVAGSDAPALASFQEMFRQLRQLGQHVGPAVLVPVAVSQTHALRRIAAGADPAGRASALRLAARFAEFTGWLSQEQGDDERALWWTDRAVELAAAGDDDELAAYAYVRRALVALYRHDANQTVALADLAGSATRDPRIRGLAAQREAQGHALAGDPTACRKAIDRAVELLSRATGAGDGPALGSTHVNDPAALALGWCQYELGEPGPAAETLHRELALIPAEALRARARWGARLALAYAGAGEVEQACAVVEPVLTAYEQTSPATVRGDLRDLARTLNRWHRHRPVRDTRLRLTATLADP